MLASGAARERRNRAMRRAVWIATVFVCAASAALAAPRDEKKDDPGAAIPAPADKAPPAGKDAPAPRAEPEGPSFGAMDADKDGGVTWNEFLPAQAASLGKTALLPAKDQTRIKKMFKEADLDRSTILTEQEWTEYGQAQLAAKAPRSDPAGPNGNERGLDSDIDDMRKRVQREQVKQMMRNMQPR